MKFASLFLSSFLGTVAAAATANTCLSPDLVLIGYPTSSSPEIEDFYQGFGRGSVVEPALRGRKLAACDGAVKNCVDNGQGRSWCSNTPGCGGAVGAIGERALQEEASDSPTASPTAPVEVYTDADYSIYSTSFKFTTFVEGIFVDVVTTVDDSGKPSSDIELCGNEDGPGKVYLASDMKIIHDTAATVFSVSKSCRRLNRVTNANRTHELDDANMYFYEQKTDLLYASDSIKSECASVSADLPFICKMYLPNSFFNASQILGSYTAKLIVTVALTHVTGRNLLEEEQVQQQEQEKQGEVLLMDIPTELMFEPEKYNCEFKGNMDIINAADASGLVFSEDVNPTKAEIVHCCLK